MSQTAACDPWQSGRDRERKPGGGHYARALVPDATIVIVTKDRMDDLRVAIRSSLEQIGDIEVLVIDDGSTDGSADMVAREFPDVRLLRTASSIGYIRQRNRGARAASSSVIVSIDDDCEFMAAETVTATLSRFDHPRVAAVTIPFVQARRSDEVLRKAPAAEGLWVTSIFPGGACAIRRDLMLEVGGYLERLEHILEDVELSMRLLRHGYVVRLGHVDRPVVHHESSVRDPRRDVTFLVRNHALIAFLHVPLPFFLERIARVIGFALWNATRWGVPRQAGAGIVQAVREMARHPVERRPLSRPLYRAFRRMRQGHASLADIEALLPITPAAILQGDTRGTSPA